MSESRRPGDDEGRLGQVHLPGDGLHLPVLGDGVDHSHGRRIPVEGLLGEGVDHDELHVSQRSRRAS